jgi:peptidoglycan/LPS O-acetylase OafA/YrhL
VRLLDGGPLRALGACSYSLYLIHLPIVALVSRRLPGFWPTVAVAVPACLLAAHMFAAALERPAGARGKAGARRGNPHRAPNGCCG